MKKLSQAIPSVLALTLQRHFGRDAFRRVPIQPGPSGTRWNAPLPIRQSVAVVLTVLVLTFTAQAQVVQLTVRIDNPTIAIGGNTRVRVFAQVTADRRATTDRIFSWYLDFLNSASSVAQPDYNQLQKPASDQDPRTSSTGSTDGANRRGIYDTFINRPGAGVNEPVELFSIPVTGVSAGRAIFHVQAGTSIPSLAADFIVAPRGGGDPLVGANYAAATASLDVTGETAPCSLTLSAVREQLAGGQTRITLSFTPCAGRTHFIESRDSLTTGAWVPLPNGPHNTGTLTDTFSGPQRFYRVRIP